LGEFGARPDAPAIFRDVLGNALPIAPALFRDPAGRPKTMKHGRERHLLLLADTLREPDEVWVRAVWIDDRLSVRYRYLARYTIEGDADVERSTGLVVFELARDGWVGVTAFRPERERYLAAQREGVRVYRRQRDHGDG
jgi:hypothetical protein